MWHPRSVNSHLSGLTVWMTLPMAIGIDLSHSNALFLILSCFQFILLPNLWDLISDPDCGSFVWLFFISSSYGNHFSNRSLVSVYLLKAYSNGMSQLVLRCNGSFTHHTCAVLICCSICCFHFVLQISSTLQPLLLCECCCTFGILLEAPPCNTNAMFLNC